MLRRATRLIPRLGAAAAASAVAYNLSTALSESAPPELGAELATLSTDGEVVENWSGTHSASPSAYFQPETPAAVQRVVDLMGVARRRLRVVGSALSPNGMGLSDDGMLNMAFCAGVVSVDAERRQVTVQAGAPLVPSQASSLAQRWPRYISGYPTTPERTSHQAVAAAAAATHATRQQP